MMTFNIVPIPGCCFNGIHSRSTPRLTKNVRVPMLKLVVIDSPSAKTVHGLIPVDAVIINDSPKPNRNKPKHSINIVNGLGAKFNAFSELHLVVGTDLIKKIFISTLD